MDLTVRPKEQTLYKHPSTPADRDAGLETPTPLVSRGLHVPAAAPGPMNQQFITLGGYHLLSRLAVGGMAEVYLARHGELSGFKTLVVVKKVLPHLAVKPEFIAMFLDEARIASMLDHPNVVHIAEVGRVGDEYFLAMELVQGKPLAAILQHARHAKVPLPHPLAALIIANAAAGLHHAHELTDASGLPLGLVHRDVSPQNIMVSFEGSVKVIDFGIARALGRLGDTAFGSLKGKLGYMAPEQSRGKVIDARADLFSLGVVLWECIAGKRMFRRENEMATLRAVVCEPIPSVSKYGEVDPGLDAIVRRAVARNIDDRFQSAEELRIALERWVFSWGSGASTHDLASLMKSWFPSEHAQWHRAARIALDMQGSVPPIEVSLPNVSTAKTHPATSGGNSGLGSGLVRALRSHNRNHSYAPAAVGVAAPAALPPPKKSWLRFAVAAVFLPAILYTGGLVMALSAPKVPVDLVPQIKPGSMRAKVEILPAAPPSQCNASQNTQSPAQVSAVTETGAVPETTVAVQPVSDLALGSKKRAAPQARASRKRPSTHRSINTSRSTSRVNNKNAHPNPF